MDILCMIVTLRNLCKFINFLFTLLEIHLFDPLLDSKDYLKVVIERRTFLLKTLFWIIVPTLSQSLRGDQMGLQLKRVTSFCSKS